MLVNPRRSPVYRRLGAQMLCYTSAHGKTKAGRDAPDQNFVGNDT